MKHIVAFLIFMTAVVGLLFTLSGNKAPRIPDDGQHTVFDVEEVCWDCHGPGGDVPRKETHPPKDRCLECHNVKDSRRKGD